MNEPINHVRPPHYYSHPEVDAILNNLPFDKDTKLSIQYVLKVLVQKHHLKVKMAQDDRTAPKANFDPECWLPSIFYEYLLSSHLYKSRLTILVDAGVLKSVIRRSTKGRHTLYRLAKKEWNRNFTLKQISSHRVIKKISSYFCFKDKSFPDEFKIVRQHIIQNFTRIDLTQKVFNEIWRRRYENRYLLDHADHRLTVDQYMERGEVSWMIINQWNHASDLEKLEYFSRDDFGHRLHHVFTYLPKEIRPYILDRNGAPISFIEFDMANCQPTIFANLLVQRKPHLRSDIFVKLCESFSLYKHVEGKISISNRAAKTELIHMLYCKPYYSTQKQFELLFPVIAKEAKLLKELPTDEDGKPVKKGDRYTLLPQAMQRAESRMFGPLRMKLIELGYKILPIHDAVYVANINDEQQNIIQNAMEQHIGNYIKIRYKIKQEKCSRMI